MKGLESVLVATDFSRDADLSLERAALICAAHPGARCRVIHVVEPGWLDGLSRLLGKPVAEEWPVEAAVAGQLRALADAAGRKHGIAVESEVRPGRLAETVAESAVGSDLLVIGARGTHPMRRFAVGTTAEGVLRRVATPTLVVRHAAETGYRRVLVAVDGSAPSRAGLEWAARIAGGADIHILHVYSSPYEGQMRFANVPDNVIQEYRRKALDDSKAEMSRFIAASGVDAGRWPLSIEHGDHVPSRIMQRAEEIGADLVIAGRHGKSLTEQLLLGSVTLHLLAGVSGDVLVTH